MAALLVLPLTACKVTKTREGEVPQVDAKGGRLPEYKVEPAQVEVSTTPVEVKVPEVDVHSKKETVNVPHVSIKMPGATPTPTPYH
jgi:hypothetical protein